MHSAHRVWVKAPSCPQAGGQQSIRIPAPPDLKFSVLTERLAIATSWTVVVTAPLRSRVTRRSRPATRRRTGQASLRARGAPAGVQGWLREAHVPREGRGGPEKGQKPTDQRQQHI